MDHYIKTGASITVLFLLLVIAVTVAGLWGSSSSVSEKELLIEEARILDTIRDYVGHATRIDVHPQSLKLTFVNEDTDSLTLYLFEKNGRVILKAENDEVAISSQNVSVNNLAFNDIDSAGKTMIEASFTLAPRTKNSALLGYSNQKAAIFDSPLLPLPGATINLGNSSGDVASINDTLFFDNNGRVGISGPPSIYSENRLKVNLGGIQMTNPSATEPTCDSTKRGTLWLTQPGGSQPDGFQACLRDADGTYFWADYNPL